MNYKEISVGLPIKDNNIQIIKGIVQYDDANVLNIQIIDAGSAFDFTGYSSIVLTIKKPDGTSIVESIGSALQVVNPANGSIRFNLGGQATTVIGMHYMTLEIYAGTARLTTAKLNYYVAESQDDAALSLAIQSQDDFPVLQQMIAANSSIAEDEAVRQLAEAARAAAEAARAAEASGIVTTATAAKTAAEAAAASAKQWYLYLQQFIEQQPGITVDIPTVSEAELKERLAAMDCGAYVVPSGTVYDKILLRRGLAASIPVLTEGELGFSTDSKELVIGTADGNLVINKPVYQAGTTAPTDTEILWIDTANDNAIKFYDLTTSTWKTTSGLSFV